MRFFTFRVIASLFFISFFVAPNHASGAKKEPSGFYAGPLSVVVETIQKQIKKIKKEALITPTEEEKNSDTPSKKAPSRTIHLFESEGPLSQASPKKSL